MTELPRGTVTLLFTDIEGSTRLLQELGEGVYVRALAEHRRLLREAFAEYRGVEVEMQGDSFHFAFWDPCDAVLGAARAQRLLADHERECEGIRVRIGVHTGEPLVTGALYAGLDVHRAARVMSAGHGGQVLLSQATVSLVEGRLPDGLRLRDLGEHRLKDLSAPQRLHQLGLQAFPPLASLYQTNIPVPATPFLGRQRELREVTALLSDSRVRLLTLTGAGGTGKTRLGAQAAADVAALYPDGVFWVGLASLREPGLLSATIGRALRAEADLGEHIGAKRLLLVLDNFEQLMPAAMDLADMLSRCPGLNVLVTSREPLNLAAERVYAVLPLDEADAVSLFHERARAAGGSTGDDEDAAAICRRLDHLPLAIELAAARLKVLSERELFERLEQRLPLLTGGARDLPERHRTLRATVQWSFDGLSPDEQLLFARLSVFAGGCTFEAAEEVCGADLDTLQSLVDKSLLRHTDDRFWMLETIREFAAERLDATGEGDQLAGRHARFVVSLAEQAEQGWLGPAQRKWLDRLDAEQSNLRSVLSWLEATDQPDAVLALVGGIRYFWATRGDWREGLRWVVPALERTGAKRNLSRAKALGAAGMFASPLGELETARHYAEASLELFRELGSPAELGRALGGLAAKTAALGEVERARELFEEAAVHLRDGDDWSNLAVALTNLADLSTRGDNYERAESLLEEALKLYRAFGREQGLQYALFNLAFLQLRRGRHPEARGTAVESLLLSHQLGDARFAMLSLSLLGSLAAEEGDPAAAATLLGAAEAERIRVGLVLAGTPEGELHESTIDAVRSLLGAEVFAAAFAEGSALTLDRAVGVAEQQAVGRSRRPVAS